MASTNRIALRVTAPAEALRAALLGIDGVNGVELRPADQAADQLEVECNVDDSDGIGAAIARAVAPRWELHRLARQHATLENIFLHYIGAAPTLEAAA